MRAFVLVVPTSEVDLASDVLWQLGVRAVEERPAGGTGGDAAGGTVDGTVELWTHVGDGDDAWQRARDAVGGRWPDRIVDVDDAPATTWRDHARPMWIDDGLVVVPAWLDEEFGSGPVVVSIEPGGAFGLGDHPTTLLTLRALHRLVADDVDLLDVGCGTGVLAVAGALLQRRPVRAVDVSDAAVEATKDNARRNGVAERIVVDTTSAGALPGDFDVVVANILAPVLIELSADLRRLTRPDGALVISGILADQHPHVLAALAPMVVERTDEHDGWAAVTLRHPVR